MFGYEITCQYIIKVEVLLFPFSPTIHCHQTSQSSQIESETCTNLFYLLVSKLKNPDSKSLGNSVWVVASGFTLVRM
jgi:hypothetical protein